MKTKYSIKNFRIFDEKGVTINMAPLTILTGCNSSGKSSVAKSCLLLDSFMKEIRECVINHKKIDVSAIKLNFSTYPNNLLGKFGTVINRHSKNREILFSYTAYSYMLGKEVEVEMTFSADDADTLDNGYLRSLIVRTKEGIVFALSKDKSITSNLTLAKESFFEFALIEFFTHCFTGLEGAYELEGKVTKDEYENQKSSFLEVLKSFDQKRREDVFSYIKFYGEKHNSILNSNISDECIDAAMESMSLIRIPLATKIQELPKELQVKKLNAVLEKEDDADIKYFISRIITDFADSNTPSLTEYLSNQENKWLEKIILRRTFPTSPEIGLPDKGSLRITQNKFLYIPNRLELVDLENGAVDDNNTSLEMEEWRNGKFGFQEIYESIMHLNHLDGHDTDAKGYYLREFPDGYQHRLLEAYASFIAQALEEILLPEWSAHIGYIGSSRVNIKRLYDVQENSDFSNLLRSYFEAKRIFSKAAHEDSMDTPLYAIDSFMNKWIKTFGIAESVELVMDEDATGVKIYLVHDDNRKNLLADEGYGITQLVSILLQIETSIMSRSKKDFYRLYGLQPLDKFEESRPHYYPETLVIEEPEIHLHPRYQSLLADMFAEATGKYNIHFIIETHSEYLIRRLQVLASEGLINSSDVSVNYVDDKGHLYDMGLMANGLFKEKFGPGFFDEAGNSHMALIKRERRRR